MGDRPKPEGARQTRADESPKPSESWVIRKDGKVWIDVLAMEFNTNASNWLSEARRRKADQSEG